MTIDPEMNPNLPGHAFITATVTDILNELGFAGALVMDTDRGRFIMRVTHPSGHRFWIESNSIGDFAGQAALQIPGFLDAYLKSPMAAYAAKFREDGHTPGGPA